MATAAILNAASRLASTRLTAGSPAAYYIAARSAPSRFRAPGSASSRLTAPGSAASRFAALHPAGDTRLVVRCADRLAPLRCAADAPPPTPADAPSNPPSPLLPPSKLSKLSKLWTEVKPMGYSLAMLLVALGLGFMASKENPKDQFTYLVTLCEKTEKVHKILSHFLPLVKAIIKIFW